MSIREHKCMLATGMEELRRKSMRASSAPNVDACSTICQRTSAYVSIRSNVDACSTIRQRTSAYVSIRSNVDACSTIRQRTSAYVSIRSNVEACSTTRTPTASKLSQDLYIRRLLPMCCLKRLLYMSPHYIYARIPARARPCQRLGVVT